MRTRRSPRNQEILWRALGGKAVAPVAVFGTPCCWNCRRYPPAGRARGECTLLGQIVNGRTQRSCFESKVTP